MKSIVEESNAESSQVEGYIKSGSLDGEASRKIEDLLLEANSGGELDE